MSYMRVTRGQWHPSAAADSEAAKQLVDELIATMRGMPGNKSFTGGVDSASGRTIAVSIWDTEEHAKFTNAPGDLPARLRAAGLNIEPSEFFEERTGT